MDRDPSIATLALLCVLGLEWTSLFRVLDMQSLEFSNVKLVFLVFFDKMSYLRIDCIYGFIGFRLHLSRKSL